jgi:hypothetical protein
MRVLKRVALALVVAMVAVAAYAAWYVYGAWPVPAGYEFPRHSMWGSGPTALYEGMLVEEDGCIRTATGSQLVIWPPGYSLALVNGEPVVRGSGQEIRMGQSVRLGGGFYDDSLPVGEDAERSRCGGPWFITTGLAD